MALIFAAGCQTPPGVAPAVETPLVKLAPSAFPEFKDDLDFEGMDRAIGLSLDYLKAIPMDRGFDFGPDRYTAGHMVRSLQRFQSFIRTRPAPAAMQKYIRADYHVYQSAGRDLKGEVLFTGYYEPRLKGSRAASPAFRYPIYARPDDLLTIDLGAFSEKFKNEKLIGRLNERAVVPYYERREIDTEGAIYGKARVVAWVADPVELFFLHIQGSGRILFEDGGSLHVNYDSGNGRPYRSVGQLLIDEGRIPREEMSMQRIRAYLDQNPADIERVLNSNPSYVFFKPSTEGPLGALNVKLTPGRSLALDRKVFPSAALAFAETKKPLTDGSGKIKSWVDCSRFMLNQDTGGAIQGPGRADFFWGGGAYAEIAAGHLKHPGKLYLIVLRPDAAAP
jgi:membrane-bound lytic murein transglycosylase A